MYLNQTNSSQVDSNHVEENFDEFLARALKFKPVSEPLIRVNVSRNTLLAIIISILVHLGIFFFAPKVEFDQPPASPASSIEVSLAPPQKPAVAPQPKIEPPKNETIAKPVKKTPPIKPEKHKPIINVPTTKADSSLKVPDTPTLPPPPVQENKLDPSKFPDMASYMKAVQASRQGTEYDAARQNAEAIAKERGPSAEQMRDERIKNNFKSGTNGIFEITSKSSRHATFAFKGWTNDYSNAKLQYFEVEAGSGQDIRLMIIKRMIALIREHYQGDFTWESRRLARSVTQSARLEDNAGLEDFLMMEFFGTNYRNN
ncbi:hypothetical protein [Methylotenera mobilis]|uniref:Uncharacterized protein n=1 Tax=Methylotenera mobilis (strain JLW8 / ATCC BAA-1282 / DSM 17540) TaxID=583345 RepID=C6WW23_METML|nr:hypothetical protein [Methylotenera mobilis]ACT48122.1 conserved hypothetical protein [Methylotenera mobilis JLW8]